MIDSVTGNNSVEMRSGVVDQQLKFWGLGQSGIIYRLQSSMKVEDMIRWILNHGEPRPLWNREGDI